MLQSFTDEMEAIMQLSTLSRRAALAAAVAAPILGALPSTALADVTSNPNAIGFGPATCPSTGQTYEALVTPTSTSKPGLVTTSHLVGVAKSLAFTSADGVPIIPLFDTVGAGLDERTVWCYWPFTQSPTGFAGGDILFRAAERD